MSIYILSGISSFLSGMGIGGGAAFIIFATMLNILDISSARAYNLILFVAIGISIIIKNINKKIFNKEYFKTLFIIIIGCIIGYLINKSMPEKIIKICFYSFMIIIGGYEIISCLITIKNEKNNIRKE